MRKEGDVGMESDLSVLLTMSPSKAKNGHRGRGRRRDYCTRIFMLSIIIYIIVAIDHIINLILTAVIMEAIVSISYHHLLLFTFLL